MRRIRSFFTKKTLIIGAVLAIGLLAGLFILEKTGVTDIYSASPSPDPSEAKTTSTAPSAQEDFTQGGDRQLANTDNKEEGTLEDNSGNISSLPPESQWTTSSDGRITVYGPVKNSLIASGSSLSGASNLSRVYFRLIDDVSGVIAQGTLSVINGKFSGTFNFSTSGTQGRLDVFNATADGVESSNIEIPVKFR